MAQVIGRLLISSTQRCHEFLALPVRLAEFHRLASNSAVRAFSGAASVVLVAHL